MMTTFQYVREKLDWAADRIVELPTGPSGYKVRDMKAPTPDVCQFVVARLTQSSAFRSSL